MDLNEAKSVLKENGFLLESTEIPLTPEEEAEFLDEFKFRFKRIKPTKTKGIKITGFGEPIWVKIWKNGSNYEFNCSYVTIEGMYHEAMGSQGKSKTVEGLMNKIKTKVYEIVEENDELSSQYNRYDF